MEYLKTAQMKRWKGSFTIELACLMPLILLVVLGVWSAGFYLHHKVWLTAAAYEAAVTGSAECVFDPENGAAAARLRAEERRREYFDSENAGQLQAGREGDEIRVVYTGEVLSFYGGMRWRLQAEGASTVCRPAEWIRKVRLAQNAAGSILGE